MKSHWIGSAVAMALTVTLMLGTSVQAQNEANAPNASADATMSMPAFDWQRSTRLPVPAKLKNCAYQLDTAIFSEGGQPAVIGAPCSLLWRSGDGTWRWDQLDKAASETLAARGTAGLVIAGTAIGQKGDDVYIYIVPDDGGPERVARFKGDRAQSLVTTPDGYALVSVRDVGQDGRGIPTFRTSVDGRTWSEPTTMSDSIVSYVAGAIGPGGTYVYRDTRREDGGVLRSTDGTAWEELVSPGALTFDSLIATSDAFVAGVTVGADDARTFELWRSPDGVTWTPTATTERRISRLAAGPEGVVAIVTPPYNGSGEIEEGAAGAMLWSPNGVDWCGAEVDTLNRVYPWSYDVADDGRLLVSGTIDAIFSQKQVVVEASPIPMEMVACAPLPAPRSADSVTLIPAADG